MKVLKPDSKWSSYCGLTCEGGSEQRQCKCQGPLDCELQNDPDFGLARADTLAHLRKLMKKPYE